MGLITANGHHVLALRHTLPLSGIWVTSLEIDVDEALAGAVAIADEGVTYQGTIVRSGVLVQTCTAEVVGGAGGLSNDVAARSYQGATARVVVTDILSAVGETLDQSSTPSVLNTTLTFWTRASGRAGTALSALADKLGANWRILPNGRVWIGLETWPSAPDTYEALELDRDDAAGSVLLAPETLGLAPGVTFDGRRVGRVEHHVSQAAELRTTFWIES